MIHYMTVQGLGDPWIGSELLVMRDEGIPVTLHALRHPASTFYTSDNLTAIARDTKATTRCPRAGR
jgi:hypothetical protein